MHPIVSGLRRVVDVALEAPVVTSFTRVGADVRSRVDGWAPPDPGSLDGRVVLLTGGTSGIGRAAARALATAGAEVVVTGRDPGRATAVWLAADDGAPLHGNGGFWLDRRRRSIHRMPTTRRSDTPERRARLWELVAERSGADV